MVSTRGFLSSILGAPDVLGQLAVVKLKQEVSSQEPNLRRYLGHQGVFIKCITAAHEHSSSSSPRAASGGAHVTTFAQPRRVPETPNKRAQIFSALKAIVRRRSAPRLNQQEDNTLSRVRARDAEQTTRPESQRTSSTILRGLSPLMRLKHMMSDKAIT
ncbi:hypothetical protein BJY01DRAFT_228282 [Aspergillus pseudoustus]|uniref:Uncharacterized protein n=1 Tax=Aspergillus pseudoustus TaxID=1810923 RepID=A0ABR4ILZ8_9EURO